MDFSIPAHVKALLGQVETLVDERVIPLEGRFLREGMRALEPELEEVRAEVRRQGLWAPQAPKDLGGLGLSLVEHGLLSAALGRSPLGHYAFGCQAPDAGNIEILHLFGTDAQRERWLRPLVAGHLRSCFCMTEPENPGSNPVLLSTTARRDGDEYVIDGHKWFSSSADGASVAVVMAVTDPGAEPHRRASMFLVPTDTPGFVHVRNIPIMGNAGTGWASHAEVRFEGCRVPVTALLGEEGAGFTIAQERLGPGRIHHCMRWIGIAERALFLTLERARTRDLGKGLLADQQTVQTWIAEGRARLDAARLAVLHAAWKIEAEGQKAARVEVSAIKFLVAEVMLQIVDRAVQAHGALGITDDTVLGFFYAHERGSRIYDGPDEVHKQVVARALLKGSGRGRGASS